MYATREEVELMLREGAKLAPSLLTTRILRAYSGVRPLVAADDDPTGRSISRGIVLLDHATRDGLDGFVTITGGKLMTYRLMAEWATDLVCKKLSVAQKCTTDVTPLVGSEAKSYAEVASKVWKGATLAQKAAAGRHGDMSVKIPFVSEEDKTLVCECENVTLGEIKYAVEHLGVKSLGDLRRRTRVGMGTCQGTYCIYKAAAALAKALGDESLAPALQKEYLDERWKGMRPVGWGDTLREMEFMQKVYKAGKPFSFKD